jgi:hypothetical protein
MGYQGEGSLRPKPSSSRPDVLSVNPGLQAGTSGDLSAIYAPFLEAIQSGDEEKIRKTYRELLASGLSVHAVLDVAQVALAEDHHGSQDNNGVSLENAMVAETNPSQLAGDTNRSDTDRSDTNRSDANRTNAEPQILYVNSTGVAPTTPPENPIIPSENLQSRGSITPNREECRDGSILCKDPKVSFDLREWQNLNINKTIRGYLIPSGGKRTLILYLLLTGLVCGGIGYYGLSSGFIEKRDSLAAAIHLAGRNQNSEVSVAEAPASDSRLLANDPLGTAVSETSEAIVPAPSNGRNSVVASEWASIASQQVPVSESVEQASRSPLQDTVPTTGSVVSSSQEKAEQSPLGGIAALETVPGSTSNVLHQTYVSKQIEQASVSPLQDTVPAAGSSGSRSQGIAEKTPLGNSAALDTSGAPAEQLLTMPAKQPILGVPPVNHAVVPHEVSPTTDSLAVNDRLHAPLSGAEVSAFIQRGDTLLARGEVASARLFYERAADAGNAQAALRLGTTFDFSFLARINLSRAYADRALAISWYRRALVLGAAEAGILIAAAGE